MGGTFRIGSDHHYPEEAPCHRVSVDGFWIDRTPVTNRQFKAFVKATGYVMKERKELAGSIDVERIRGKLNEMIQQQIEQRAR